MGTTFLSLLSQVSRGSVEDKLKWVFDLYDLDSDGKLTKDEMVEVVTSIYEMLGMATQPAYDDTSIKEHVDKVFTILDPKDDGYVEYAAFADRCREDETLVMSLGTLDTVL